MTVALMKLELVFKHLILSIS